MVTPEPTGFVLGTGVIGVAEMPVRGSGSVRRLNSSGFMGVQMSEPETAELKALGIQGGVKVDKVEPDLPAAKAGMQDGDIIYQVDSQTVNDREDLVDYLGAKKPGEKDDGNSNDAESLRDERKGLFVNGGDGLKKADGKTNHHRDEEDRATEMRFVPSLHDDPGRVDQRNQREDRRPLAGQVLGVDREHLVGRRSHVKSLRAGSALGIRLRSKTVPPAV